MLKKDVLLLNAKRVFATSATSLLLGTTVNNTPVLADEVNTDADSELIANINENVVIKFNADDNGNIVASYIKGDKVLANIDLGVRLQEDGTYVATGNQGQENNNNGTPIDVEDLTDEEIQEINDALNEEEPAETSTEETSVEEETDFEFNEDALDENENVSSEDLYEEETDEVMGEVTGNVEIYMYEAETSNGEKGQAFIIRDIESGRVVSAYFMPEDSENGTARAIETITLLDETSEAEENEQPTDESEVEENEQPTDELESESEVEENEQPTDELESESEVEENEQPTDELESESEVEENANGETDTDETTNTNSEESETENDTTSNNDSAATDTNTETNADTDADDGYTTETSENTNTGIGAGNGGEVATSEDSHTTETTDAHQDTNAESAEPYASTTTSGETTETETEAGALPETSAGIATVLGGLGIAAVGGGVYFAPKIKKRLDERKDK